VNSFFLTERMIIMAKIKPKVTNLESIQLIDKLMKKYRKIEQE